MFLLTSTDHNSVITETCIYHRNLILSCIRQIMGSSVLNIRTLSKKFSPFLTFPGLHFINIEGNVRALAQFFTCPITMKFHLLWSAGVMFEIKSDPPIILTCSWDSIMVLLVSVVFHVPCYDHTILFHCPNNQLLHSLVKSKYSNVLQIIGISCHWLERSW